MLLIVFPRDLISFLEVPEPGSVSCPTFLALYSSTLGSRFGWSKGLTARGLGLGGAIAINLCGALVLAAWLLFGDLALSIKRAGMPWGTVVILIVVSLAAVTSVRHGRETARR